MAKKKYPPNPLPCGCGAKGIQDLENAIETGDSLRVGYKQIHVVHCPLHAAAPDLLYALRTFVEFYEQAGIGPCEEGKDDEDDGTAFSGDERFNVRLGRTAIRKATNSEQP